MGLPDSETETGCDLLFISHLTAADQWTQDASDPYFGSLPWQLQEQGYRIRIALIDHTTTSLSDLKGMAQTPATVVRTLIPRRLERKNEAVIAGKLAAVAARLRYGSDEVNLRRLAARQAKQGASRQSLRIGTTISQLVGRHRPKALVFTYEGHAWERIAMHLSRQIDPDIRCIAVHHAILAPMQHAMTTSYGGTFDPDVILAAGRAALAWLSHAPGLKGIPVDLLGSPRARSATPVPDQPKDGKKCLFLPEGMVSESIFLAHAAYDLAAQRPDLTCTIRLHPLTSRDDLASREPRFRTAPSNIEWSPPNRTLDEDGHLATWAVYRGSSAVLSAMTSGAIPVYLGNEPLELQINPLRGAEEIVQVINHSAKLATSLDARAIDVGMLRKGWDYAQSYYTQMDSNVILRHAFGSVICPSMIGDAT